MATAYLIMDNGETWVSYWEPGVVPIIDAGTPTYHNPNDGRTYIPLSSGGGSSGGGSSGGYSYYNQGDSISPGDYGGFSPGPSWSPGPAFSPGPSRPRFDPPVRPPEERSGILFPVDACWLLDNHEGQDEDIYARVEMDMGPARLRRKYRVVPHVRKAKIFLTSEQSKIFHEWFEWTLGVGQLRWIGQFHDIGYGIRWFEAEFVKPWEAEFVALGTKNEDGNADRAWKVSVEVRLYGEGQIHNPLLDPNAVAKFGARLKLPLVTESSLDIVRNFTISLKLPLTSSYTDATMVATFSLPVESRTLPTQGLYAEMFTYLSSSAKIGGWARLSAEFGLPLT